MRSIFSTLSYVGIWDTWSGGDHGELHWYGWTMQRVRTHLYSSPHHFRLLFKSLLFLRLSFAFWWIYCIPLYSFLFNFMERTLEKKIRIHHPFQFCFSVALMFLLFSSLLLPSSHLPSSLSYLFALGTFFSLLEPSFRSWNLLFALGTFFSLTSFNIYFILVVLIL